jgi:dihydropteroate synthase
VIDKAGEMLQEGASILDLGGQSTRPRATRISAADESQRVLPFIAEVKKNFPECWISVDTFYASVAEQALQQGADLVNDISAGEDDQHMLEIVAKYKIPYVAMHKKGTPQDMQNDPEYSDVVLDLIRYFREKKVQLESMEIFDWMLDPGFGFGKTLQHNYAILNALESFAIFQRPVLIGLSRKGMVQKALGVSADGALNGTTALHMAALQRGAAILRAHDVKEAMQCISLHQLLAGSK